MATSGSTVWVMTRDQIIAAALRKLGVLAKGQTADSEDLSNGMEALNAILGQFLAIGMPLWKRIEYTFPIVAGTYEYEIGIGKTLNTVFPIKVIQSVLVDSTTGSSIEMQIRALYEFNRFTPNVTSGQPVQFYYTPMIGYGKIRLWPTPDASAALYKTVKIVYQAPMEDFTVAADNLDMPKEWHQAVIYALADALAPEYGTAMQERQLIKKEAKDTFEIASSMGTDMSSLFVQPDGRRM